MTQPGRRSARERFRYRSADGALIRGLGSEIAVTKVTLPRGKHGVKVDSKGNFDKEGADKELRQHGPAILPGMPVEITRLMFKSNRLILEINGGGKSGKSDNHAKKEHTNEKRSPHSFGMRSLSSATKATILSLNL